MTDVKPGGNSNIEVADIFQAYGNEYRRNNGITKKQHQVMTAIAYCRSDWFGYHEDECNKCGHVELDFNSCRDRHCPKCQGISRRKWIKARLADVLPVPYYHVVFTLPHRIHSLLQHNKKNIYNLLFSAAAQTLLTFGRDPKWLGGEIGFYGVLHTWGQTLWAHPHLHFLVPGGALTEDNRWITAPWRGKFLFPVHALSKVFKGKFIEGLKDTHAQGSLSLPAELQSLREADGFEQWLSKLACGKWVVFCKSPLQNAEQVIRYIGRYTHRVAISNSRILDVKGGEVAFTYRDYKTSRTASKIMRLAVQEFIRRFLWHVLPSGFHKIRHFGFLANGRRKVFIPLIKQQLNVTSANNKDAERQDEGRLPCPVCKEGSLIPRVIVTPYRRIILALSSFFKNSQVVFAYDST